MNLARLGFSPELTPGAIGIWTLLGVVVVALIRVWPLIQRLKNEATAAFRSDLLKRVTDLERQHHDCIEDNERIRRESAAREDKLRDDFGKLIDGMRRQLLAYQLTVARYLPDLASSNHLEEVASSLRDNAVSLYEEPNMSGLTPKPPSPPTPPMPEGRRTRTTKPKPKPKT